MVEPPLPPASKHPTLNSPGSLPEAGGRRVPRSAVSISELPAGQWDDLAGPDSFYVSYDWLRSQENADWAIPSYHAVYADETIAAASVSYELRGDVYRMPHGLDAADVLLAGGRTGYHNSLLARARDESLRDVAALLATRAARTGRSLLLFDYLDAGSIRQLAKVTRVGCLLRDAEAVIDVPDGGFDGYLWNLPSKQRRTVRAEKRAFDRSGLTVETARLSECVHAIDRLVALTLEKYGVASPLAGVQAFLSEQVRYADAHSVVFLCHDPDGWVVGCCVCFEWRSVLYCRVAGFDYPRLRDSFEYFNTVYYHPISYMESRGLRRLHLGCGSLDAKIRRGACLRLLWAGIVDVSDGREPGGTGFGRLDAAADRRRLAEWRTLDPYACGELTAHDDRDGQ